MAKIFDKGVLVTDVEDPTYKYYDSFLVVNSNDAAAVEALLVQVLDDRNVSSVDAIQRTISTFHGITTVENFRSCADTLAKTLRDGIHTLALARHTIRVGEESLAAFSVVCEETGEKSAEFTFTRGHNEVLCSQGFKSEFFSDEQDKGRRLGALNTPEAYAYFGLTPPITQSETNHRPGVQMAIVSTAGLLGLGADALLYSTGMVTAVPRLLFSLAGAVTVAPLRQITGQEPSKSAPVRAAIGAGVAPCFYAATWAATVATHSIWGGPK